MLEPELRTKRSAHDFAQHLLTKAAERLRRGDYYCRRLGAHLSWVGDFGGWWDETDFHETRDTGFLLARLEELWQRVPRTKPLSVGVVLLDLVPANHHQPDLFDADSGRRQKLSPLVDRINDRYGRCSIGFGLFPSDVRAFKGHAAFHRVPDAARSLAGIACRRRRSRRADHRHPAHLARLQPARQGADRQSASGSRPSARQWCAFRRCRGAADVLVAGEGIETMLALKSVLPLPPMIAALSANHLAAVDLSPALFRRLYVARDNDAAGINAAKRLHERGEAAGIEVRELVPVHGDINADLCRLGRLGAARAPRSSARP